MVNIVIYSKDGISSISSQLKLNDKYSVRIFTNDKIKNAEDLNPDLIILDSPPDVLKDILVKNKIITPLLIVSDHIFKDIKIRAEVYDYILNSIDPEDLEIRIHNMVKIKQLKEEIKRVSTTDELTGLYNRKYIHQRLEEELSRAKRYNLSISCLLLDIDFFKVVNDMYGYDWGDILLKRIAESCKDHGRKADLITRYGDEEFLIVLPNTDEDNAYIFAERLRRNIERMVFIPEGEPERHPVTVSGGLSCYPFANKIDDVTQTLIRYAEHALYNAKRRGRNKIIQFSQINLEV